MFTAPTSPSVSEVVKTFSCNWLFGSHDNESSR